MKSLKKIIFLCFVSIFVYGKNDLNATKNISTPLKEYKITKKMKIYQKEKAKNEAEAKKLEEDGFCPCSIQQP